jgi:uncharacterized protein YodC (DUF2158 family)
MGRYKVGDTVQLKSGGPIMTVTNVRSGIYTCTWFDGTEVKVSGFPEDALIPTTAGGPMSSPPKRKPIPRP